MEKPSQILGVFNDPDDMTHAVESLIKNNVKVKDVYSPFPIEEVWELLKMKTRIPYLTFIYGAIGTISVFAFLYWTSVINYPLTFGGKPHNSLSFIVIMFVLTILFGVVFTLLTLQFRENLWPGVKSKMPDTRATDDKFIIVIDRKDMGNISESELEKLLKDNGADEVNEY